MVGEENQAVATRPDCDREETRHDTNEQPPAQNADQATEQNDGMKDETDIAHP
jgi:hypothetical protein